MSVLIKHFTSLPNIFKIGSAAYSQKVNRQMNRHSGFSIYNSVERSGCEIWTVWYRPLHPLLNAIKILFAIPYHSYSFVVYLTSWCPRVYQVSDPYFKRKLNFTIWFRTMSSERKFYLNRVGFCLAFSVADRARAIQLHLFWVFVH